MKLYLFVSILKERVNYIIAPLILIFESLFKEESSFKGSDDEALARSTNIPSGQRSTLSKTRTMHCKITSFISI